MFWFVASPPVFISLTRVDVRVICDMFADVLQTGTKQSTCSSVKKSL